MTTYKWDKTKVIVVHQGEARFTNSLSADTALYTSNADACVILIACVFPEDKPIRTGLGRVDYNSMAEGIEEFFKA